MGAPHCRACTRCRVRVWPDLNFLTRRLLTPTLAPSRSFILPAIYFIARGKVSAPTRWKLLGLGLGIGFQGALGWYMVKSGLDAQILDTPGAVPRVSQYRLAAHLSAALALYVGMLSTAEGVRRDWAAAHGTARVVPAVGAESARVLRRFKRLGVVVGAMVFLTAVSGESSVSTSR